MAPQDSYHNPPPPPPPPPPPNNAPPYTVTDWVNPETMHHRQPVTVSVVSTVTVNNASPVMTSLGYLEGNPPTSTSMPDHSGGGPMGPPQHHNMSTGILVAIGLVGTSVFIVLLVSLCCYLLRKARKTKRVAGNAEMGDVGNRPMVTSNNLLPLRNSLPLKNAQAYMKPPSGPSPSTSTSSSASPITPISNTQAPPIILSTTVGHSYLTGIDTSDHISLADNRSTQSQDMDEPPPPYRPRSIAPISRECSVHIANGMLPNYRQGASIPATEESIHNPFEDPEDGGISDLEDDAEAHHLPEHDHLSVVSDLSYQQEPTTVHSAV
jgi:hypothetical protein